MNSLDKKILSSLEKIVGLLSDRRCENVITLNVTGLSEISDCLIIASGTSQRQLKAVGAEIIDSAKDFGITLARKSEDIDGTWVVLDFIDIVVHLFEPNRREYYDLEGLWSDAAVVSL